MPHCPATSTGQYVCLQTQLLLAHLSFALLLLRLYTHVHTRPLPYSVVLRLPCCTARELTDRLYCCYLGHLYHLARGELLHLGMALRLPEAAGANASVLQLGRAAFGSAPAAATAAGTGTASPGKKSAAAAGSPVSISPHGKQQQQSKVGQNTSLTSTGATPKGSGGLNAGVELLTQAAAAGSLSPRMVAQLQELLMTPLCGFSMMVNKYADGSGNGLTYEVNTPKLQEVRGPHELGWESDQGRGSEYIGKKETLPCLEACRLRAFWVLVGG